MDRRSFLRMIWLAAVAAGSSACSRESNGERSTNGKRDAPRVPLHGDGHSEPRVDHDGYAIRTRPTPPTVDPVDAEIDSWLLAESAALTFYDATGVALLVVPVTLLPEFSAPVVTVERDGWVESVVCDIAGLSVPMDLGSAMRLDNRSWAAGQAFSLLDFRIEEG